MHCKLLWIKASAKCKCIRTSKKIWISQKRSIFWSLIWESETRILYRLITEWNISSLYFLNFYVYALQIMKTQNWVSQKIRILHKINKKKNILHRNVRLLKSMFISMHSILGWASFCMNYCINAAWRGDNQPVALLGCNEAQVALIAAFRSSALLGLLSLIFLLTIPHRFSMAIKHSNAMFFWYIWQCFYFLGLVNIGNTLF